MENEKRLIDAKALEKQIKQAFEDTNPYVMGMMLRWIRKQTKVDAVEVVRCKDCKWYNPKGGVAGQKTIICSYQPKDFFCAYGERRTECE